MGNKVLIVEDEFTIALDLKKRLTEKGYDVLGMAKNYEEALAQLEQNTPDVILLDINLNDEKDGIELGKKIRSQQSTPIIFVTSYADNDIFEKAVNEVSPEGYLVKPIRDNELYRTLKIVLKSIDENDLTPPPYVTNLSEREKEVMQCLKDGSTDIDIADTLHISVTTVRTHLRRAYSKLLLKNRVEAVNFMNKYKI